MPRSFYSIHPGLKMLESSMRQSERTDRTQRRRVGGASTGKRPLLQVHPRAVSGSGPRTDSRRTTPNGSRTSRPANNSPTWTPPYTFEQPSVTWRQCSRASAQRCGRSTIASLRSALSIGKDVKACSWQDHRSALPRARLRADQAGDEHTNRSRPRARRHEANRPADRHRRLREEGSHHPPDRDLNRQGHRRRGDALVEEGV